MKSIIKSIVLTTILSLGLSAGANDFGLDDRDNFGEHNNRGMINKRGQLRLVLRYGDLRVRGNHILKLKQKLRLTYPNLVIRALDLGGVRLWA